MDLQIRVRKQVLTCRQVSIANSVNFVRATFQFDSEWNGTQKHVIFSNGDIPSVELLLDETQSCIVPWEVLQEEGDLFISVVGILGDIKITTKLMDDPIKVYASGELGGSSPNPPTPSIWDKMGGVNSIEGTEEEPFDFTNIESLKKFKYGLNQVKGRMLNTPELKTEDEMAAMLLTEWVLNVQTFEADVPLGEGFPSVHLELYSIISLPVLGNYSWAKQFMRVSGDVGEGPVEEVQDSGWVQISGDANQTDYVESITLGNSEGYLAVTQTKNPIDPEKPSGAQRTQVLIDLTGIGYLSNISSELDKTNLVSAINSLNTKVNREKAISEASLSLSVINNIPSSDIYRFYSGTSVNLVREVLVSQEKITGLGEVFGKISSGEVTLLGLSYDGKCRVFYKGILNNSSGLIWVWNDGEPATLIDFSAPSMYGGTKSSWLVGTDYVCWIYNNKLYIKSLIKDSSSAFEKSFPGATLVKSLHIKDATAVKFKGSNARWVLFTKSNLTGDDWAVDLNATDYIVSNLDSSNNQYQYMIRTADNTLSFYKNTNPNTLVPEPDTLVHSEALISYRYTSEFIFDENNSKVYRFVTPINKEYASIEIRNGETFEVEKILEAPIQAGYNDFFDKTPYNYGMYVFKGCIYFGGGGACILKEDSIEYVPDIRDPIMSKEFVRVTAENCFYVGYSKLEQLSDRKHYNLM